jgi:hypothetical protein
MIIFSTNFNILIIIELFALNLVNFILICSLFYKDEY